MYVLADARFSYMTRILRHSPHSVLFLLTAQLPQPPETEDHRREASHPALSSYSHALCIICVIFKVHFYAVVALKCNLVIGNTIP